MDIETRLEELAQAYAAGRLNEAELARLQEEALRMAAGDDGRSRLLESGLSRGVDPVGSPAAPGALAPGRVIGPPERQMRLVHDLSGRGRLWLAHTLSSSLDSSKTADEFRAIKIFLPADRVRRIQRATSGRRGRIWSACVPIWLRSGRGSSWP